MTKKLTTRLAAAALALGLAFGGLAAAPEPEAPKEEKAEVTVALTSNRGGYTTWGATWS